MANTGNRNTGNFNTGNWNTGNRNTGDCNTGDCNTGNWNTGNRNTGDCNTGNRNTGNRNTGNWNTGNRNTGNFNTGNWNTGNRNTGDCNTGNWNTGNRNTGNRNTGNWNTGNFNTGFFCTNTPSPMFFDKPWNGTWDEAYALVPCVDLPVGAEWVPESNMSDQEKNDFPNYKRIGGFLRKRELPIDEAFPMVWAKMDQATKDRFTSLPNFDADKFLEITGVDVRKPDDIIEVDGVKYKRIEE